MRFGDVGIIAAARSLNLPYALDFLTGSTIAQGAFTFARASIANDHSVVAYATGAARYEAGRGLLIEDARTNLAFRSEQLLDAYWTLAGQTGSASNQVIAPDGATTSDKFAETAGSGSHSVQRSTAIASAPNPPASLSVWMRYAQSRWWEVRTRSATTAVDVATWVDLQNAAIGTNNHAAAGVEAAIQSHNRYWFVRTTTAEAIDRLLFLSRAADGSTTSHTATAGDATYFWGFQFEAGGFPSSYMVTNTTAIARAAESCVATRLALVSCTVLVKGMTPLGVTAGVDQILWQSDDNSAANLVQLVRNASRELRVVVKTSSVERANLLLGTVADRTAFSAGLSFGTSVCDGYLAGGTLQQATPASVPSCTRERLGHGGTDGSPASHMFGWLSKAQRVAQISSGAMTAAVDAL